MDADLAAEVAAARADPRRAFGRFTILGELGRGGMGAVYRAFDPRGSRVVALKVSEAAMVGDEEAAARLDRESKAAARLRHAAIVSVHESGAIGGRAYIVMDLIDGRTLEEALREGLARDLAVGLLPEIARGLHHAHEQGVIHRDVKPSNIFIERSGVALLGDFGLARIVDARTRLTLSGAAIGTPGYMSPEQAGGEKIDARTDVYGLGAVLYRILAGRPPFEGAGVNVVTSVLTKEPVPPRSIDATIKPAIEQVCLRALSKEPDERYTTAAALARAIEEALVAPVVSPRSRAWLLAPLALGPIAALAFFARPAPPPASVAATPTPPPVEKPKPAPEAPAWWSDLPASERPPLPLPRGLRFGEAGEYVNVKDGSVLLYVPAGAFTMGREKGYRSEMPAHTVELSPYFIGKLEVTLAQFGAFAREEKFETDAEREGMGGVVGVKAPVRGRWWCDPDEATANVAKDDTPVVQVSWFDAKAYCSWAGLSLPTDAQWERAASWDARTRTKRAYPWGDDEPGPRTPKPVANLCDETIQNDEKDLVGKVSFPGYVDGISWRCPVGSFPAGASPVGALDMAGNVREWCQDVVDDDFYARSPRKDPVCTVRDERDPTILRSNRGGSFYSSHDTARATYREAYTPKTRMSDLGFRVARSASDR